MGVAEDVEHVAGALGEFLRSGLLKFPLPILTNPVLGDNFRDFETKVESLLEKVQIPDKLDIAEADEATQEKINLLNSSLGQLSRDFVVKMAFTKVADSLISETRNETEEPENIVTFEEFHLSKGHFDAINQLLLLLDALISFSQNKAFPSARNDFYQILQLIVESLASQSSETLAVFWYALEKRHSLISRWIFDQKVTLNRIAMLGICNGVTDKYYHRGKTGKYDSYEKDSFNDKLHARVRTFLSSLLLFDDLTGLNKYFAIANRVNREPNLGMAKTGDDKLLQDILQFHRLLRDPYAYLKNTRMLSKQVESLDRLYGYLLDEEEKYAKKHPVPDVYKVREPILDEEKAKLTSQFKNAIYFPEHYWLAPFEEIQRGQKFDEIKAEDQKVALKRFDSSKYRQLLLLQMYLVSAFFLELQSSRKRAVVKSTGGPASTKHVAEDSTPELLIKTFLKIKRDIPRLVRSWDTQLSFLLQHLSQSEEYWWAWLIYGKDAEGKPLLGDKPITGDEIKDTAEKFEKVAPYKVKRYFNTHATPQLSRKMRTKTGLSLLELPNEAEDYDARIEELSSKISAAEDEASRVEWVEERSVLLWKKAKSTRASDWLKVSDVVSPEDLGLEKPEQAGKQNDTTESTTEAKDTEMVDGDADGDADGETGPIVKTDGTVEANGGSEEKKDEEGPTQATTEETPLVEKTAEESRKRARSPDDDEEDRLEKKAKVE